MAVGRSFPGEAPSPTGLRITNKPRNSPNVVALSGEVYLPLDREPRRPPSADASSMARDEPSSIKKHREEEGPGSFVRPLGPRRDRLSKAPARRRRGPRTDRDSPRGTGCSRSFVTEFRSPASLTGIVVPPTRGVMPAYTIADIEWHDEAK